MDLESKVIRFTSEFLRLKLQITSESTLFGDLGLDGQDAVDFIASYAAAFKVDLKQVEFSNYFGSERSPSFGSLNMLWKRMLGASPEVAAGLMPLRVGDLINAARHGHLR